MRKVPLPHELQLGLPIPVACESVLCYGSTHQIVAVWAKIKTISEIRNEATVYN